MWNMYYRDDYEIVADERGFVLLKPGGITSEGNK
jgi:hypothetical protein